MINLFYRIRQSYLKRQYQKARKIYIIARWARWGVLEARWSGKFDENGEPITIQYSDHNGTYESYFLAPWYRETTGWIYGYSFNEKRAKAIAEEKNKNE